MPLHRLEIPVIVQQRHIPLDAIRANDQISGFTDRDTQRPQRTKMRSRRHGKLCVEQLDSRKRCHNRFNLTRVARGTQSPR